MNVPEVGIKDPGHAELSLSRVLPAWIGKPSSQGRTGDSNLLNPSLPTFKPQLSGEDRKREAEVASQGEHREPCPASPAAPGSGDHREPKSCGQRNLACSKTASPVRVALSLHCQTHVSSWPVAPLVTVYHASEGAWI